VRASAAVCAERSRMQGTELAANRERVNGGSLLVYGCVQAGEREREDIGASEDAAMPSVGARSAERT